MPRPRKSVALHEWQGTHAHYGPDTESKVPGSRPKVPRDVDRGLFKEICKQLESRRTLTEGDRELVRLLCVVLERHARAVAALGEQGEIIIQTRKSPTGESYESTVANPWLRIAETSERTALSCLDRLGLSPISRDRVKQTLPSKESREVLPNSIAALRPDLFGAGPRPGTKHVTIDPPTPDEEEQKR